MSDARTGGPLAGALDQLAKVDPKRVTGRVTELCGLVVRAAIPQVRSGELVRIATATGPLLAEVVGFKDDEAVLMPLGEPRGLGPRCEVEPTGRPFTIRCGAALLGRVIDGLGAPCDGLPPPAATGLEEWAVERAAPDPLTRRRVTRPLALGVRAIDGLLTVGEGQRVGLFAGSGVGKSTLLGQIARNTEADVNVICLCGERGREVRDFLEESLGPAGLARAVVVCATSDAPSLVRLKSAYVATAVAEWFRERGQRVLFLMDSVTRFARALREVGLAAGEPPARQGYPRRSSPRCRASSSAPATARRAPSPPSTPCWSRAATWTSPSPTRCAASSTATSCSPACSARAATGPPSTCSSPSRV